jgi:phenylacetate-CoA ligase
MKQLIKFRKKLLGLLFYDQAKIANRILKLLQKKQNRSFVESYTLHNLKLLLSAAKQKVPYYKNIPSTSLSDFPVVDKNIMKKDPKAFIDKTYPFYHKILFNTGGSTGEPFVFYTTRIAGYVDQRHQRFVHTKIGYKKGDKLVSIGGLPVTEKMKRKNIYWAKTLFSDATYGSYNYSSVSLDENILAIIIDDLNQSKKPSFLRGYPSAITALAEYIEKMNVPLQFQLKGIVLTAENIMQWQIELINRVLKTNVYGQYGHSEKCIYAFTEANSLSYICSPYYGFVEVLNEKNEHVQVGETGKVVVTSYYNKAMYFIRYDTGDLAEYGGINEAGWVILNHISGRKQDFIYGLNKKRIDITALVFGQHFKSFKNIDKWQIIQTQWGKIEIDIVRRKDYAASDENEIRSKFYQLGFETTFRYVAEIPLTARGKYRFVNVKLEI